jgi:fluoride exporter
MFGSKRMPFSNKDLDNVLLVGAGGFLGAVCRFLLCQPVQGQLGTLSVNVLGSFLLGLIMYEAEYTGFISPRGRLAFGTGFIGAFTTFSTFAVQSFTLPFFSALGNISANLFLTLGGIFLGRSVIKSLSNQER